VNDGGVDVGDLAVVIELVVIPITAIIAAADIAVSVIHAAVVADVTAPIPLVPTITARIFAPVSWRPQRPSVRSKGPNSRNPVITGRRIGPVARRPNVVWVRTGRLLIFRQRRRWLRGVLRNLVLISLTARLIGVALVLLVRILSLRLLVLSRLLLPRLLILSRPLLLRLLCGVIGSRGCSLGDRSSAVIGDRRKVSILRSIHLIGIVLVATRNKDSQQQHG
jgi:hypothetical protein